MLEQKILFKTRTEIEQSRPKSKFSITVFNTGYEL